MNHAAFLWSRVVLGCVLLLVSVVPCPADDDWVQLSGLPPGRISEDLFELTPKGDGALIVGTNGTVLFLKSDDTFVEEDSGTTADLYSIHCKNSALCAFAGVDIVAFNKYEGSGWQHLVDTSPNDTAYTPVLATDDRVFFGQPDFSGIGFNRICYQEYNETPGMCRVLSSPLISLGETLSGIRGVTKRGDIFDWSFNLSTETAIHTQPVGQDLEVARGVVKYMNGPLTITKISAGTYDYRTHPGTTGNSWTAHPIPFTADSIGLEAEPGKWLWGDLLPKHVTVVGSNTAGTEARIFSTSNGGTSWQQEGTDLPSSADNPLLDLKLIIDWGDGGPHDIVSVGESGTVIKRSANGNSIFIDGFENGSTSTWSVAYH